jgi:hypothetical protein
MMRGCLYGTALTAGRALWLIVDVRPRSPLVAPFGAPMPARILVLDDGPAICALVARALGEQGYEVVTIGGGLAGLEAAERDGFDLVITNNCMPGMSGSEVIERLHNARRSVAEARLGEAFCHWEGHCGAGDGWNGNAPRSRE